MKFSITGLKKDMRLMVSGATFAVVVLGFLINSFAGGAGDRVDSIPVDGQFGQVSKAQIPQNLFTSAKVVRVVDGDTIVVQPATTTQKSEQVTVRLIGVNTPETVDPRKKVECFGREASNEAKELLENQVVRLDYDSSQNIKDKYGRLLAYVYIKDDGADDVEDMNGQLFVNKYMIENGYAYEYTYEKPYKYQKDFKKAQKEAQAGEIGLWSPATCNGKNSLTI